MLKDLKDPNYRMPAEWEKQKSTWVAWPHNQRDWPNKFQYIPFVFCEIISKISIHQKVNILIEKKTIKKKINLLLKKYLNNTKNKDKMKKKYIILCENIFFIYEFFIKIT